MPLRRLTFTSRTRLTLRTGVRVAAILIVIAFVILLVYGLTSY